MPKCAKDICPKPASRALKFEFYHSPDCVPAIAYISLYVCDEHNLTDEEVVEMIRINWAALMGGFIQKNAPIPVRELTKFAWRPLEEAQKFWEAGALLAGSNKIGNN